MFWIGWAAPGSLLVTVGTKQWFVRDDWAFVVSRQPAQRVVRMAHSSRKTGIG